MDAHFLSHPVHHYSCHDYRAELRTNALCKSDSGSVTPPVDVGSNTFTMSSLLPVFDQPTSPRSASAGNVYDNWTASLSATEDCQRADPASSSSHYSLAGSARASTSELHSAADGRLRLKLPQVVKTNTTRNAAAPAKKCERFVFLRVCCYTVLFTGNVFIQDYRQTNGAL